MKSITWIGLCRRRFVFTRDDLRWPTQPWWPIGRLKATCQPASPAQRGFTGTTPGPGFPISPEIGSGMATGFHAASTSLWSGPAGNGSPKSLSSNMWGVGDYYQFQVSTLGAPNVALCLGSNQQ